MDRDPRQERAQGRALTGGPAVDFGRPICGNLADADAREWLCTNGLGGFAAGTVSGAFTRRYHGLLFAALSPPVGRTLLVSKLEETVRADGKLFALGCNRWRSGAVSPEGYRYLERFYLDGATPVWTYALGGSLLEKRIFMRRGENSTYTVYRLLRGSQPVELSVKALGNHRDYHGATRGGWGMRIESTQASGGAPGLRVTASAHARPYFLFASPGSRLEPRHEWYRDYELSVEKSRGFDGHEDHLFFGELTATLAPGRSLTVVATTEAAPDLDGDKVQAGRQEAEAALLARASAEAEPPAVRQLILAADQFIVDRPTKEDPHGTTVIAGYPWFGDWGRDTMIALPGLTLCTGQPERARSILRTFARFVDQGLLPNRFPDAGERPEYNTADATLHYFEAIRLYHAATGDDALLGELFPLLSEIVGWHERGTHHCIRVDPSDSLLRCGEAGVQLTWMDAKVGDWVVTPRRGKPVEINALWYSALLTLAGFAERLGQPEAAASHRRRAEQVKAGFARFLNPQTGYCFDVLDGPDGPDGPDDPRLRPNQLFAISLPHSPLEPAAQKAVVDACARHLVTSHGLRSLGPDESGYLGHYGGDVRARDAAYHQGTVWSWLIGPFVLAHYRVYGDAELARSYLLPLLRHLPCHGLGSISEIFDGDPPHLPRGCIAQAWSVGEWLRAFCTLRQAR